MKTRVFYSHGKLLLSAEYVVLDGALALALPTNKGQYLTVSEIAAPEIQWRSFDEEGNVWFKGCFLLSDIQNSSNRLTYKGNDVAKTLHTILLMAKEMNPDFLSETTGFCVSTSLTFSRAFGLGSSSTLIAAIAQWANVNSYVLLQKSFGGSGYDVACATHNSAILYQLNDSTPEISTVTFNPPFKSQLYFVYLNKKQNSREAISSYSKVESAKKAMAIKQINVITKALLDCNTLEVFNKLLQGHEHVISELLSVPTVQERLFASYTSGSIKSLGAWGGDFVLVTVQQKSDLDYFKTKGYNTIFSFEEMLLGS